MQVNPDIFFIFNKENIVVWNYEAHEQYEISMVHFQVLYKLINKKLLEIVEKNELDALDELVDTSIVSTSFIPKNWEWDILSKIFHLGTNNEKKNCSQITVEDSYQGYIDYCSQLPEKYPPVIDKKIGFNIKLKTPNKEKFKEAHILDVLLKRKTCRDFHLGTVEVDVLSAILFYSFGAVHGTNRHDIEELGFKSYGYRRTSASAGSLQSPEPYIINFNVEGLEEKIYHYDSIKHQLIEVSDGLNYNELGDLLCNQYCIENIAFGVFITCRFDKLWWKYNHSRAYRVALLDVGHVSQTLQIVSTSLGLSTFITGMQYDQQINNLLKIDSCRESVFVFIGIGYGDGSPIKIL